MLGFSFIKAQPTQYVIEFRNGRPLRQGQGLSVTYFTATTSLAVLPTASTNEAFIFEDVTADYQDVTVQGQVTFRVVDPPRTAALLNFSLDAKGRYVSDDPKKLSQRVLDQVHTLMHTELQAIPLKTALVSGDRLALEVGTALATSPAIVSLGLEILALSVLAIRPKPETARALEAEAREDILRRADEAVYSRRNAAIEQERAIKENELNTEIAVETKKQQIKEVQMDADRVLRERRRQIEQDEMTGKIEIEERKGTLVGLTAGNARQEADAKAYGIDTMMKAFAASDPRVLQALASVGMQPGQMMAMAFRDLADNAGKIGQLNLSPDLLREIMDAKGGK